jgi:hypothetical protein
VNVFITDAFVMHHEQGDVVSRRSNVEIAQEDIDFLLHVMANGVDQLIARRDVPANAADIRFDNT